MKKKKVLPVPRASAMCTLLKKKKKIYIYIYIYIYEILNEVIYFEFYNKPWCEIRNKFTLLPVGPDSHKCLSFLLHQCNASP